MVKDSGYTCNREVYKETGDMPVDVCLELQRGQVV